MINITNNKESKTIDKILIENLGFSENILIQKAAQALFEKIDKTKNKYLVVVGPGNNGADGLALALLLHSIQKNVKILCKSNNSIFYNIAKKNKLEFINDIEDCDILIDAIFGVGIEGEIKGYYKLLIDKINAYKNYEIISIDLPSGNINSDLVLMISSYKEQMLNSGIKNEVCTIGINPLEYKKASKKFLVDDDYIKKIFRSKNIFSNKSDFGRVKIYAKQGAAILASLASVKCGSGYTYLVTDQNTKIANLIKNPECINDETEKANVIALGPNNGIDYDYRTIIMNNLDKKLVIDADALTYLSNNKDLIEKLTKNTVLTPHPLEFARISDFDIQEVLTHPFDCLKAFKTHFRGTIILKGKNNIIYNGNFFYVVNIGNSKMANAGMGDLLTGMISSYLAQGYGITEATIYACYKQAKIGRKLSQTKETVNPIDVINNL